MELERLKIDRSGAAQAGRRKQGLIGRAFLVVLAAGALYWFREPLLARLEAWRLPAVELVTASRVSSAARAAAVAGTTANGYVVARRRAALSADTPGRIVELNVEEGSVVEAGDVVARLYADELEAALRRAEAERAAAAVGVRTAAARVAAAERRLDEAGSLVTSAAAQRDESAAAVALAEKDSARVQELIDSGAVTRERFDQVQSALVQARARLAAFEAGLARTRSAVTTAASDVEVTKVEEEQAAAQLPALAAARDLAQATLDKTVVRAPFDGVIVLKDAEVGEVVSPNAQGGQSRGSVATMVDFASLEVQVELPETSLAAVAVGMPAEVYLDAFPTERFTAQVLRIWPTANRQKASVEVRVGLDAIDPRLRPEMGARIVFAPEREEATGAQAGVEADILLVPASAVVRVDEGRGVFVLEGDRVRFQAVQVGAAQGERIEIQSGLEDGARVVKQPSSRLADGDRVQVKGDAR